MFVGSARLAAANTAIRPPSLPANELESVVMSELWRSR